MKPIEVYFWCALYWAFYLPISLLINLATGEGDVLGTLLVGFLLTAVFILILVFEEGALIPDELEPAIIIEEEPIRAKLPETASPVQEPAEIVQKMPQPKPKRKYVRKQPVASDSVQEPPEVEPDEKKEEPEIEPAQLIGIEPEPKMRTDVDLGQLDAPDDSVVS